MRTTALLQLLKLLIQRTCIFLNSACYLSTSPRARLCLEWTLLITSGRKYEGYRRERRERITAEPFLLAEESHFNSLPDFSSRGKKRKDWMACSEDHLGEPQDDTQKWTMLATTGILLLLLLQAWTTQVRASFLPSRTWALGPNLSFRNDNWEWWGHSLVSLPFCSGVGLSPSVTIHSSFLLIQALGWLKGWDPCPTWGEILTERLSPGFNLAHPHWYVNIWGSETVSLCPFKVT